MPWLLILIFILSLFHLSSCMHEAHESIGFCSWSISFTWHVAPVACSSITSVKRFFTAHIMLIHASGEHTSRLQNSVSTPNIPCSLKHISS